MTGPRDASGLATAVEMLGAGDGMPGTDGDQVELFADAIDAPSALPPAKGTSGPQGGRPKNARNRSTEEWRRFFLSLHASPLMGLGEIYSRTADELAAELHLTRTVTHLAPGQEAIAELKDSDGKVTSYLVWDRAEAFRIQQAAMVAALPYLHQKQPLAVAIQGDKRGLLVLGGPGCGRRALRAAARPERGKSTSYRRHAAEVARRAVARQT